MKQELVHTAARSEQVVEGSKSAVANIRIQTEDRTGISIVRSRLTTQCDMDDLHSYQPGQFMNVAFFSGFQVISMATILDTIDFSCWWRDEACYVL